MAVFAVSDLHGQYDIFMKGLKTIKFNNKRDELYILGDVIDRGPDGVRLLKYIMDRPNMHLLLGNHEFMMLNAVNPDGESADGPGSDNWLWNNGGDKTWEKFEKLSPQNKKEILQWLNNCPLIQTLELNGKICLTHSFYIPGYENMKYCDIKKEDADAIVWKSVFRKDFDTKADFIYNQYDYIFYTGHVPVQRVLDNFNLLYPVQCQNLIDIDGGLAMAGIKQGKWKYNCAPQLNIGAIFINLETEEDYCIPL